MIYSQIKSVLRVPRSTVYTLVIYSLLLGFLSLTIPVSVQTLVNLVGVSLSVRPIVSLITILFVLLFAAFCIRLLRIRLIENIQQKIFVEVIIRIFKHLYRVDFKQLTNINVREKINRALELAVIQKSVSVVFIVVLDIMLQTLFCVIILAFYHPLFLVFDIMLVLCILFSIFVPLRAGFRTGLKESTSKYSIVEMLEEKTEEYVSFKQKPIEKSVKEIDQGLCEYLTNRISHFNVVFSQHIYIGVTYIVINVLLLSLGSYLIILGQLSIGQLIAAELLVNIVLLGLLKFSQYIADCYDFFIGVRKVVDLLELPMDSAKESKSECPAITEKVKTLEIISAKNEVVHLDYSNNSLNRVSLVKGDAQELMNTFFDRNESSVLKINDICINAYSDSLLGEYIYVTNGRDIVSGTVLQNLTNSTEQAVSLERLNYFLKSLGIEFMQKLVNNHIDSQVCKYNLDFDALNIFKMNIIRGILSEPKLLVILNTSCLMDVDKSVVSVLEKLDMATLVIDVK